MNAHAHADIYAFVDADGVAHFSNVPDDPRYKVYLRTAKAPATARRPISQLAAFSLQRARGERYNPVISAAASRYQVDSALLHAVILVESGYNPKAVSPKGATGLMQLMPATGKRYGVEDLYDATQNIEGGARYLRDLMQQFDNNLALTLAAYNAGERAVIDHGLRVPPYPETQRYVPKVLRYYRMLQSRDSVRGAT
ncbi:MAG: lytic transglycosylase domain-containing protein [Burkholderiales bacterium]